MKTYLWLFHVHYHALLWNGGRFEILLTCLTSKRRNTMQRLCWPLVSDSTACTVQSALTTYCFTATLIYSGFKKNMKEYEFWLTFEAIRVWCIDPELNRWLHKHRTESFLDEKPDENKQVDLGDIPLGWETCNEISYLPTLCITDLTKAFVESTLMSKPMENKSDDKCMTTPQLCSFRKSKQNRSFTYSRMVLWSYSDVRLQRGKNTVHNRFNMMGTKPIQRKRKCAFANVINMFQLVVLSLWMMQKWK